jgi:hypothetical protein
MTGRATVATDKARIVAYCNPQIKAKLEALADAEMRTLSNLVETILVKAVAESDELEEAERAIADKAVSSRKQLSISELD